MGTRDGGAQSPESSSAAALRRRWPFLAFPGSKRMRSGSGGHYAICVIHPRQRDGGLGPGLTLARRGAALGLGAHRGAACRPLCGSDARAIGSCDLRKARHACAEVVRGCRAADICHGGAAAARHRRARSRLLGAPRAKLASAKTREGRASAHRGSYQARTACRGSDDDVQRRGRRCARGRVEAEVGAESSEVGESPGSPTELLRCSVKVGRW